MGRKSSQARASALGWIFQSSAGIYLLLDCIKSATSIKMEGRNQDIEITLRDNTIIYAQAKSVEDINDVANNRKKLKSALTSLSKCTESVAKLIYVTNIINPLDSEAPLHYMYSRTSFSSFLKPDQELITKLLSEIENGADFQTAKFELVTFKFIGDEDTQRYSSILSKTKEFLATTDVGDGKAQAVLNEWKNLLMNNNAQRATLSKNDVIFPLILVVIDHQDLEAKYNKVCSLGLYDETKGKYSEFIRNIPHKSEFFMRVCGHYQKTYPQGGDNIIPFVKNEDNWKPYADEFSVIEPDPEYLESLVKLLLLATLSKRKTIDSIKQAANLEEKI